MNIPCKDCICFASCNAKVHQLNGVYKTQFIVRILEYCSLFDKWLSKSSCKNSYIRELKIICECFNLKYDITPDYNLLRHLSSLTTY